MVMTDPTADMLTRIRNAMRAKHRRVEIPASHLKESIAKILVEEGYVESYKRIEQSPQDVLRVWLRYAPDGAPALQGLDRVSRPGLRRYAPKTENPRVLGGLGVAILSTSKGVMTSKNAKKKGVGGEVLCYVW